VEHGEEVSASLTAEDELDERTHFPPASMGQLIISLDRCQYYRSNDEGNEQLDDPFSDIASRSAPSQRKKAGRPGHHEKKWHAPGCEQKAEKGSQEAPLCALDIPFRQIAEWKCSVENKYAQDSQYLKPIQIVQTEGFRSISIKLDRFFFFCHFSLDLNAMPIFFISRVSAGVIIFFSSFLLDAG